MEIAIVLLLAVIGGLFVLGLRNDIKELGFMVRWMWVIINCAYTGGVLFAYYPELAHDELRGVIIFGLYIYVLTLGHKPTIGWYGPQQTTFHTFDPVAKFCLKLFGVKVPDPMGKPAYWTYQALRYALPIAAIGACLYSPWFLVPGILTVLTYWPTGPFVHRKTDGFLDSRYFGAFGLGFWLIGAIGLSAVL